MPKPKISPEQNAFHMRIEHVIQSSSAKREEKMHVLCHHLACFLATFEPHNRLDALVAVCDTVEDLTDVFGEKYDKFIAKQN